MHNFAVKIKDNIYWISRSIATAGFIFYKSSNNRWFVLASKRGPGAADFQELWNCPCGYLDYNETLEDCCKREIYEETGLGFDSKLEFAGINDSVDSNHQNVTVRYYSIINAVDRMHHVMISRGGEQNEVEEIKWIPITDIDNYQWAFNHNETIKEIFNKYIK